MTDVAKFIADDCKFTFFANGFKTDLMRAGTDAGFVLYGEVKRVIYSCQDEVVLVLASNEKLSFRCNELEDAGELANLIIARVDDWMNRDAVVRNEERAFRATVLAEFGKLAERLEFEPLVGTEAVEAVDRCEKRRNN
jgi:hypothetical protein